MITTARQLKDLIRSLSKKKSADAQILMRNYMIERFLERISLSDYKDRFILKGGMLVAAMVGLDARSTMDLDATVKGANVSVEDVENIISSILSVPMEDGVEFQVKRLLEIMEEAEYPGVRVSMETTFDGVRTPLKILRYTYPATAPRGKPLRFRPAGCACGHRDKARDAGADERRRADRQGTFLHVSSVPEPWVCGSGRCADGYRCFAETEI